MRSRVVSGLVIAAAVAFAGRPIDLALHPSEQFFAVLSKDEVFLADPAGVVAGSAVPFPKKVHAGFRGIAWSPDGSRLFVSTDKGHLQTYRLDGRVLTAGPRIDL